MANRNRVFLGSKRSVSMGPYGWSVNVLCRLDVTVRVTTCCVDCMPRLEYQHALWVTCYVSMHNSTYCQGLPAHRIHDGNGDVRNYCMSRSSTHSRQCVCPTSRHAHHGFYRCIRAAAAMANANTWLKTQHLCVETSHLAPPKRRTGVQKKSRRSFAVNFNFARRPRPAGPHT